MSILNKKQILRQLLILACLIGIYECVAAQTIPDPSTLKLEKADTIVMQTSAPKRSAKTGKPYSSVITKKFVSYKGFLTVHHSKDTDYFEIPDSVLRRDIMFVSRLSKTSNQRADFYPGEELDENTVKFEFGTDSTINLVYDLAASEADTTSNIYKAVKKSYSNPVILTFPIVTYGVASRSYVIDVSDWFRKENDFLTRFGELKGKNDADKAHDFYTGFIHAYPLNIEIGISANYEGMDPNKPNPNTLETTASIILLPKVPMMRRYTDSHRRIGYFTTGAVSFFSDSDHRFTDRASILRWRLEPRKEDMDKWKRGELVEPQKPIIIYIDPATPKQWRPYLAAGVSDWQKAFEQAGFKNAIIGKEWPENDTTMHMDDARYSFMRYLPSETANAYGPQVHDPRSGEIIQTQIGWYANVTAILHDWYMIQAGAVDPMARKAKFDEELMGQLVRFVSSHEVGHTLGLAHNFGNSSKTPVDSLRSKHYLDLHGHTASIMDYARFNYVAQPEDSIPEIDLFPRIGDYDKWAIEWGYKPSGAINAEDDSKTVAKWADDRVPANPRLWFGDGESIPWKFDPRSQMEDLGDNAALASTYGIKNLKRIMSHLPEWSVQEGNTYANLAEYYAGVIDQYKRYMDHVMAYAGGGYYHNDLGGNQAQGIFVPEPAALQKDALDFFNEQLFKTPYWLADKEILMKIKGGVAPSLEEQLFGSEGVAATAIINNIQTAKLRDLLGTDRMQQIAANTERFGDKTLSLQAYIGKLHRGIWSELWAPGSVKIDAFRRDVQKSYVQNLSHALVPPGDEGDHKGQYAETDVYTLIKADLYLLKSEIQRAMPKTRDAATLNHFKDVLGHIEQALSARSI